MGEAEGLIPAQGLWGTARAELQVGGLVEAMGKPSPRGAMGSHTLPTPVGHLRCSLGRVGIKCRKYGEQTEMYMLKGKIPAPFPNPAFRKPAGSGTILTPRMETTQHFSVEAEQTQGKDPQIQT